MRKSLMFPLVLVAVTAAASGSGKKHPPELVLSAPGELEPGSAAAVHVEVEEPTGVAGIRPLSKVPVSLWLDGPDAPLAKLASAQTDAAGAADFAFTVPELREGTWKLRVVAAAPGSSLEKQLTVKLARRGKVMLTSDKPLYQPGETIHLRALALSAQSGRPLDGTALFEVEDAKGNKLFKERVGLSKFGVASTEMKLAQELNMGPWQTRVTVERKGGDGSITTQRGVEVKRYVLPKLKVAVTADKRFAEPNDPVAIDVEAKYFFGKPVHGDAVLTATLEGRAVETQKAKLGEDGKHHFTLKAPRPSGVEGGLSLSIEVTDGADHKESGSTSVTVSASPLRVAIVPESGELKPGIENQIFAVVTTPDGSPAAAKLTLELGGEKSTAEADASGVAVFKVTPKGAPTAYLMRRGVYQPGQNATVNAVGPHGEKATVTQQLAVTQGAPSLLVRPGKVLLEAGESLGVEVVAAAVETQARVELWKGGQLVASRSLSLEKGQGRTELILPDVSGTLELRAAAIAPGGLVARDARVLHVASRRALDVKVSADQPVYAPGETATLRFQISQGGKGTAAAVGVIAVDESVYAMQDVQPGLERAYFTVASELARPDFWKDKKAPTDLEGAVRENDRSARRERLARVLLAAADVSDAGPGQVVDPRQERIQKIQATRQQLDYVFMYQCGYTPCLERDGSEWRFKDGLETVFATFVKNGALQKSATTDLFGEPWDERSLVDAFPELAPAKIAARWDAQWVPQLWNGMLSWVSEKPGRIAMWGPELIEGARKAGYVGDAKDAAAKPYRWSYLNRMPGWSERELGAAVSAIRLQNLMPALAVCLQNGRAWNQTRYFDKKKNAFELPADVLLECEHDGKLRHEQIVDAWGTPFRVVPSEKAVTSTYDWRMSRNRFYSAGPDRSVETGDDVELTSRYPWNMPERLQAHLGTAGGIALDGTEGDALGMGGMGIMGARGGVALGGFGRGAGGGGMAELAVAKADAPRAAPPMPVATVAAQPQRELEKRRDANLVDRSEEQTRTGASFTEAKVERVREWFPETLLFVPDLETDAGGHATLKVPLADSITTWRLSALATSADGSLGSVDAPIKVFQDFFVDLDLPPTLTQGDEVAVPVSVYNYLPGAQRIRLTLEGDGLDLLGGNGEQVIAVGPGEVKGASFRVKATKLGQRAFALTAHGEKKSDAVKRTVLVKPNGKEIVKAVNAELGHGGSYDFVIPANAIPEASELGLKVYPGVVAQLVDGVEGVLRAPGG